MRVRTVSGAMYSAIAWAPFLLVIAGVLYVLASGMMHLEMISFGTEWFIGNDETTNLPRPIGGVSDEEILLDALNSGDLEQMSAALDRVGNDRQQLSAAMG